MYHILYEKKNKQILMAATVATPSENLENFK